MEYSGVQKAMKKCCTCKIVKDESDFNKNKRESDGLNKRCRLCRKEYHARVMHIIYSKSRKIALDNREKTLEYNRQYYLKNKSKLNASNLEYYDKNKDYIMKWSKVYIRNRRKVDLNFRIKHCLRSRIQAALKGSTKSKRTMELIGCTIEFLKQWLENKFHPGMSWDNYGEWHIDHKKPCAKFNLVDHIQQKECFHYTNLQPLWASENISKGAKFISK